MFPRFPWLWGQRVTSRVDTSDGSHRTEPTGRHQIKSHLISHPRPHRTESRILADKRLSAARNTQRYLPEERRYVRCMHARSVKTIFLFVVAERVHGLQSPRRPCELPALLSPLLLPLRGNVCRRVAVTSSDRTCHFALTPSPHNPSECERG